MNPPPSPSEASADPWHHYFLAARAGSPEALGALLEGCRAYLLLVANQQLRSDLRSKAGGSDMVQQTFLDAHRSFDGFGGSSREELLAWLRRILANNLANLVRDFRSTGKRLLERETPLDLYDRDGNPARTLLAPTEPPNVEAQKREEVQRLEAALARLPEHYRQVLQWRHRDHWSFAQIGAALGRSEDAAQKLWDRAIRHLRLELRT